MNRLVLFATVILCLSSLGCRDTTNLTGTVKHRGRVVVYGTVVAIGSDGETRSGIINIDGRYTISNLPMGKTIICVSSPQPPELSANNKLIGDKVPLVDLPERTAAAGSPTSEFVLKHWQMIPLKYADPQQSGLSVVLGRGETVYDVGME
jgi:hypothetical protein